MIRHMRHGSPPRLMALQSFLSPNRRASLPTPSAGVRMTALWEDLRLDTPSFLPRQVRRDLAYLGLPGFYVPRADVWTFPTWTYVYEPSLLPGTLERHVDFTSLNGSATTFVVTAVDVESGILTRFRNRGLAHKDKDPNVRKPETDEEVVIRPRHILASARACSRLNRLWLRAFCSSQCEEER